MKSTDYQALPSLFQWKLDSMIMRGARDPVLKNIDSLVGIARSTADPNGRAHVYFKLYFSLNYWLKNYRRTPVMHDQRLPAIRFLFRFVVRELSRIFNCNPQALPNILENFFGRELSAHGARMDNAGLRVERSREQIEKEKLLFNFKEKKFYQLSCGTLSVADSFNVRNQDVNKEDLKEGYANFVMSMGGNIYMASHGYNRKTKQSFFHSSYLCGEPVQCAGSILIQMGQITGMQNNSGHYQPTDTYALNLLRHLQMLGHPICNDFKIWSYGGQAYTTAHEFLAANGSWQDIVSRQKMAFDNEQARWEQRATAEETYRQLKMGVPLRTLVEQRYVNRSEPQKTWANIWDEVILDLMGAGADVKSMYESPAPRRAAPPPPRRPPPRPTSRPWRTQ